MNSKMTLGILSYSEVNEANFFFPNFILIFCQLNCLRVEYDI